MTGTTTAAPAMTSAAADAPPDGKTQARLEGAALAALLAPVRWHLRAGMALQAIASAAALAPYLGLAALGAALVDHPGDAQRVWQAVWIVLSGLGLRALFGAAALLATHVADVDLAAHLRERMIATIGRAPLSWFTSRSSGQIRKSLDDDLHDMHYLVAHNAVETTGAALTPLFGVGLALWIDWRLGLVAVATLPLYIAAFAYMSRGQDEGMTGLSRALGRVSAAIVELVAGVAVIKTFGRTDRAHGQYTRAAHAYAEYFAGWMGPMLRLSALSSIWLTAPVVLIVNAGAGFLFVRAGVVTPMQVVTTTLLALVIPHAILTVSNGMYARRQAAQAAYRVEELLRTPQLTTAEHPATPASHSVRFEDVTFSYEAGHPVVHGITFEVPQGSMTALVGASGSGKSTLATLVPRFADPDSGSVRIGGVDVRDIDERVLYGLVGFVLQDVQLLAVSIADNIRLGHPGASDEEVREVARAAQIHDVIEALPRGYDSVVGVDATLSGGERQRLSIARAILADPPVLVFDEATSFADPESEASVQRALGHLLTGRTLLVIAHRLDVVTGADQIVVLDRGRVAETGTHADLVGRGGAYARMWAAHHADPAGSVEQRAARQPAASSARPDEETRP